MRRFSGCSFSQRRLCLVSVGCRLHILWLLADHTGDRHIVGAGLSLVGIWNILIEAWRSKVLESNSEGLLLRLLMLEGVLLLLQDGLHAAEEWLLLIEEGWLHRLEHEVVLAHDRLGALLLILLKLLLGQLRAVEEDSRMLLAGKVCSAVGTVLGRNYLDIAVVWQEFHVGRAVEEDLAGDGRQRVRQIPQLVVAMREAAIVLELADACLHEVAADLCLVVRVHGTNVVPAGVVLRHWLNKNQ